MYYLLNLKDVDNDDNVNNIHSFLDTEHAGIMYIIYIERYLLDIIYIIYYFIIHIMHKAYRKLYFPYCN